MRQPTDYNEPRPGRIVRTAKWWYAPENVTTRGRKVSRTFLGIVGLVLASGIAVLWINPGSSNTSSQVIPAPTVPPILVTSGCATSDPVEFTPEQVISTSYDTLWVRDGDMSRPTSPAGGPFAGDPYPRCFARTPEGALYSAASFATGVLAATASGDLKPFFEVRASHTGNYTELISSIADAAPTPSRSQVSITGYRWNSYSPDQVSLEIRYTMLTGPSAGVNTATVYNLTWENNDWLLVVPGKHDTVQVPIDETRKYIPWGGTG